MTWLKEENDKLVSPPTFDKTTGMINCHLNETWLINNGYTQWTDEEIDEWNILHNPSTDASTSDFEIACFHFKQICNEIGLLLNNSDFKGTFEEVFAFYNNAQYKTNKGMQLAIALNSCREICEYEALKIGIGVTEWFDICWNS